MVWLLFNGLSTFLGYLMPKSILLEEQQWCYLNDSMKDNEVHAFPKGICPKVNVIARVGFEHAYYDSAVQRFNHYATRTPLNNVKVSVSQSAFRFISSACKCCLCNSLKNTYFQLCLLELKSDNWFWTRDN